MENKRKILFTLISAAAFATVDANPALTPGTWVDITPPQLTLATGNGNTLAYDIEIDPGNPATLYFQTTATNDFAPIWKSTDAGSTWSNIGLFDGVNRGTGFGRIRIDPKNPQHLYFVSELGSREGFWISTDGGDNWTQPAGYVSFCATLTQGLFNQLYDIAVDPTDFNHILITSKQPVPVVGESKDGGSTWVGHTVPMTSGPDMGIFFLYNPKLGIGDSKTWLFCSFYNGWWRTTNSGADWTEVLPNNTINQGTVHSQIYYAKSGALYTGNQPYPVRSTDNGATWQQVKDVGLDPGFGYYFVILGDGNYLYTAHSNLWGYMSGATAVSSESDGLTWTPYNGGKQILTNGPTAMAFDSINRIMYSSNLYALLALKVTDGLTGAIAPRRTEASPSMASGFPNENELQGLLKSGKSIDLLNCQGKMITTRNADPTQALPAGWYLARLHSMNHRRSIQ